MKAKAGDVLTPARIEVRAESMPVWAAALRDPNPIHLDQEAVRTAGLGNRVINQGPANMGYMLNGLAKALPGSRLVEFEVRFLEAVRGGDVVIADGCITDVEEGVAICRLALRRDDDVQVLSGTARVRLAD
jgi:acyl dehydratase